MNCHTGCNRIVLQFEDLELKVHKMPDPDLFFGMTFLLKIVTFPSAVHGHQGC